MLPFDAMYRVLFDISSVFSCFFSILSPYFCPFQEKNICQGTVIQFLPRARGISGKVQDFSMLNRLSRAGSSGFPFSVEEFQKLFPAFFKCGLCHLRFLSAHGAGSIFRFVEKQEKNPGIFSENNGNLPQFI